MSFREFLGRGNGVRKLILAGVVLCPVPAGLSQGCAQCRDNAAAAPPETQRAYRHAIVLLAVTGGALFTGTLYLFRNSR